LEVLILVLFKQNWAVVVIGVPLDIDWPSG